MDKMAMETKNKTLERLEQLKELLPEVITETKDANGDIVSAIDAKKLEQLLSTKVIEGDESYDFTWVGKKQAMVEASRPIRKTLRPCKEESVDWEKTENLYIEGDNLDVLKLLQESYLNKIKMIYIDPPYNTGNDFIYNDNFTMDKDEYEEHISLRDENGNKQFSENNNSNPRFHSDWCSMMYPRLKLARNLLSEDGVIFISIDDNEVHNMRKICDEVFGYDNFINCIAVKMSEASGVKMKHQSRRFPKIKEYILFYKKNSFSNFIKIDKYRQDIWDKENNIFLDGITKKDRERLIAIEDKGEYDEDDIKEVDEIISKIKKKTLSSAIKEYGVADENLTNWLFENSYRIIKTAGSASLAKLVKSFDKIPNQDIACALSNDGVLFYYITDFNRDTTQPRLQVIFADSNIYKNPCDFWQDIKTTGGIATEGGVLYKNGKKPLQLLNRMITMCTKDNDIVLDFFSGSSSTAHSCILNNQKDGYNRRFIMVQVPEDLDDSKKDIKDLIVFLDGIEKPHYLTEIGKERIRRAGKKIVEETGKTDLDIGFRVLKLDESNMKDVYYAPADYNQSMLDKMTSNIKEDRTPEDLLYACMLEWELELSLPHETKEINGYNIHIVNEGDLIACFDDKVSEDVIKQIADMKPLRVVFRDCSFATDSARINVDEIFKLKSPNTNIKVL